MACADPCIDDGLGQQGEGNCQQAVTSEGTTSSVTDTDPVVDSTSATPEPDTEGMTGSQSSSGTMGDTLDGTDTMDGTETSGGTLWCVDADGDGYGDPDQCQQSDEPVPGSVDNDDDCDDQNESTFPGAAPNDDRRACMQDEDGDDWGDAEPPAGVEPGTDCIDENGNVFPGAAENEQDLCAEDEDGDGWGDTEPPPGADAGTDCADDDPAIHPGAAEEEMPPDLCAQDQDGDGWGDADPPPGVDPGSDCGDDDPNIFPGAAENEPQLCAEDNDDDGWGDSDPPPGVDPGSDCDDGNVYTFPGAAPSDDPLACMQDEDDDDWGDDVPPPGVVPGTDCDDANPLAYPGVAPNETPSDLCTVDEDGDGWGDANPGGGGGGGSGPQSGSDCYDTNFDLNPDTVQLTTLLPYQGGPVSPRTINTLDPTNGALGAFVTLLTPLGTIPDVNLVSATFNENLEIFANDLTAVQLHSVDYELTCNAGLGELAPIGVPYGAAGVDIVCGLEFGDDGNLYGISHNLDALVTFDPVSGALLDDVPLTRPDGTLVDINSCGMARDCTEGRLLVANGIDQTIYGIDEVTGQVEPLRYLSPYLGFGWIPVGLEYDPVSRMALLSTGTSVYRVDLENDVPPVRVGSYEVAVSNLQYLPICGAP